MSKLSNERILELASGKNVKSTAVENFLFSVGENETKLYAERNAMADCRSYCWNVPTRNAILQGIREYFAK